MSEEIQNQFCDKDDDPTILDLHKEQTRQATVLESVRDDVKEIKEVLVGGNRREGLVVDVDRLKESNRLFHTIFWVVFTAAIGTSATVIATYIK